MPPNSENLEMSEDPFRVYSNRVKGLGIRRWIELVGELHRLGYERLRLAPSIEDAGPAPIWFGEIAPVNYFRKDHGAVLAQHPFPLKVQEALRGANPNAYPMFTSRWCNGPDYPWPGFLNAPITECAEQWISKYAKLAIEGEGADAEYATWYTRMLETTSPTGLITAYYYWVPELPNYMYVTHGPNGCDRFPLPPPGTVDAA